MITNQKLLEKMNTLKNLLNEVEHDLESVPCGLTDKYTEYKDRLINWIEEIEVAIEN